MKGIFALLLANIFIATNIAASDIYVYGSNTPIYYPEKNGAGVKINMVKNKFQNKKARNSGKADALFVKVLIATEYDSYRQNYEDGLKQQAKNVIDGMNTIFSTLGANRPLEVLLSGLVVMKTPGLYEPTSRASVHDMEPLKNNRLTDKYRAEAIVKGRRDEHFREAIPELEKFAAWLEDNKDQFESFDANVILYISPYYLSDNNSNKTKAKLVMGLAQTSKIVCSSKPIVLVSDLIGDSNAIYAMAVSYALGVSHNDDKSDYPYFTGSIIVRDSKKEEWRKKAVEVVQKNYGHSKYECLKPTQSSDDYDNE
ncbi:GSCOCG00010360001-RA-CDS [Cotesia congregata]|uniref:Uncharacterized protein n=1 Tax=Cotesia congregata TaxID=51543 RepID=A0A8J2H6J4_COTCN|nr:GSCOCG00010360001-RA-CDS [Cotesia congregata]CAG5078953.1 Protein of unknown function [Cotesia congregata]